MNRHHLQRAACVLALAFLTSHPVDAQNAPASAPTPAAVRRAQATLIQRMHRDGLYWIRFRQASEIQPCQIQIKFICIGEHNDSPAGIPSADRDGSVRFSMARDPRDLNPMISETLNLVKRWVKDAPDNGWFVGQLARWHVVVGDADSALVVAEDCRASEFWCVALKAFAREAAGSFHIADSLYSVALSRMPEQMRCRWSDISVLLTPELRRTYASLNCDAKSVFEERYWWLSRPLFSSPVNERRLQHYSRRVLDSLFAGAEGPFGQRKWDASHTEMLMRVGLAHHWLGYREFWAHLSTPAYTLFPAGADASLFADISKIGVEQFDIAAPLEKVMERYRPIHGHVLTLSQAQVVAFPRGDSLLLAVAVGLGNEPMNEIAPLRVGLYRSTGPASPFTTLLVPQSTGDATFRMMVPRTAALFSVEALSLQWDAAARMRFGWSAPPQSSERFISDLLLYNPDVANGNPIPASTEAAIERMLPRDEVLRAAPVGIYWEVYGVAAGDSVSYTVSVNRENETPGLLSLKRAQTSLQSPAVMSVKWEDPVVSSRTGGGVTLKVSTIPAGTYSLHLTARAASGRSATVSRMIRIVDRIAAPRSIHAAATQRIPQGTLNINYQPPLMRRVVPPPGV